MENLAYNSAVWRLFGERYNQCVSSKPNKVISMKTLSLIITVLVLCMNLALAEGKKVAVVKIMRGEVDLLTLGKTTKLKVDDWVEESAVVKTGEKSFVKLVFIDKSQMNVGPNSEMKIEKFSGNDSGVIELVKGKLRSQVTKDYLQIKDKDKSKLFIKTSNAIMGIRGTDFMISTNGQNTAAILFEGEVVFNKMDSRGVSSSDKLEDMVDRGVRMHPGEFSVVEQARPEPTVPSLLNIEQREKLEKNGSFERHPSNSGSEEAKKTVVPDGLSGKTVSNESSALRTQVSEVSGNTQPKTEVIASSNPDGFIDGNKVKPANGSFVHIDSGIIIPPGKDSILDTNTNTYIPGPDTGKVSSDGSYQPPKNIEITGDGKIMAAVVGSNGERRVVEIPKPSPVKLDIGGPSMGGPAQGPPPANGVFLNPNDPANKNSSGGVTNVNDAVQQFNYGPKLRTINVCNGAGCP